MKTHTQQQTKLEIETTATELILSRQKQSEYKPRKWRGNTLVPVIIALAISAIATVAFLNQGADLTAKNKVVIAQNEIASALSDWVVSREATGGARATAAITAKAPPAPGNNIFGNTVTFGVLGSDISSNTFGNTSTHSTNTRFLAFPTNSVNSCNTLATRFTTNIDGIGNVYCINNAIVNSADSTGDILVIMLN